jgi:hypothetical protein
MTVKQKTRSAATITNQILSRMISTDMINVCQSIMYVYAREQIEMFSKMG